MYTQCIYKHVHTSHTHTHTHAHTQLTGLALVGLGSYLVQSKMSLSFFMGSNFFSGAILIIISGISVFFITGIGICGAISQRRMLLVVVREDKGGIGEGWKGDARRGWVRSERGWVRSERGWMRSEMRWVGIDQSERGWLVGIISTFASATTGTRS